MTEAEINAVQALGHAWNAVLLAVPDAQSRVEACASIHQLQNLVLAQATIRNHPQLLRQPASAETKGPRP